jgi:hypothetical protein
MIIKTLGIKKIINYKLWQKMIELKNYWASLRIIRFKVNSLEINNLEMIIRFQIKMKNKKYQVKIKNSQNIVKTKKQK